MANAYLQKFGFQPPVIESAPNPNTTLFVVIPCFDEPNLIASLKALNYCNDPEGHVEIITIINHGINATLEQKTQNQKTYSEATQWAQENTTEWLTFHFIEAYDLPKKHAGVGLARKIGMDEAVARLEQLPLDDIPIICFDADAKCTPNYLMEIQQAFNQNPKAKGAAIYFEHPINESEFDAAVYNGIIDYELHLRYYKNAFEYTGHPHACYTIGSSMAVMASAYQSQGGMNKRKAGEDFYFMQKIIERYPVIEINSTVVIPSPRPSHRVPFGTGRAISEFEAGKNSDESYAFQSFLDVKQLIDKLERFYLNKQLEQLLTSEEIPDSVRAFFKDQNFEERIDDLYEYGTNWQTFQKRFYNWFNAFRVLKYVHFARDNYYANCNLNEAMISLGQHLGFSSESKSNLEWLEVIREFDEGR